jgi:hypothetical protein
MSNSNYPLGVTSKDFDDGPKYTHSFELEISDLESDDEHPYSSGIKDLIVDVTVTNSGVEIHNGTYFLRDQDGGTYREEDFEQGEKIIDDMIIEKALEYDSRNDNRRDYQEVF